MKQSPQNILTAFLAKGDISLSMVVDAIGDDYHLESLARWSTKGIPSKYWGLIRNLSNGKISIEEIYDFSNERRRELLSKKS